MSCIYSHRPEVSSAIRQWHSPQCSATSCSMCRSSTVSDQSVTSRTGIWYTRSCIVSDI